MLLVLILAGAIGWPSAGQAADLAAALAKVRAVGAKGEGHPEAAAAIKIVTSADISQLTQILAAMDEVGPLAENWLRGAAEAVAYKTTAAGGALPIRELEKFLAETSHSPRARRLAYEMISTVDPTAEKRLIPTLLDDPSLELRRDAVAQLLADAGKISDKAAALPKYRQAFHHSRDPDQIRQSSAKLKELGETPDIATHMGYVMTWKLIGPFDNEDDGGWDVAYPPESKIDLAAQYDGQKEKIRWIGHTTEDAFGTVDLNKALGKHKGAVAYAYAELIVDRAQPCDLRIACPTANKIWLNGALVTANHVYHAGYETDQYTGRSELKKGKNAILLKICQNEQTEGWAQDWKFQFRVCDKIGTAILSQDRPSATVARLTPSILRAR
jgi:hypothetical protein